MNITQCSFTFYSCWLSTENYFVLSFVVPAAIVVLVGTLKCYSCSQIKTPCVNTILQTIVKLIKSLL